MKTWRKGIAGLGIAVLCLLAVSAPAQAQGARWWLQVVGDNNEAVTQGRCAVLTAGANTAPTIYTTTSLATAKTNPLTMDTATGVVDWYAASGTTAFDVLCFVDAGPYKGARLRVDNVTRTGQHTVRTTRAGGVKVLGLVLPTAASLTATTTTATLPAGAVLREVLIHTLTAVATATANVGLTATDATATISYGGSGGSGPSDVALCSAVATSTAGQIRSCGTAARDFFLGNTASTIRLQNQNHATGGLVLIYYFEVGNEP